MKVKNPRKEMIDFIMEYAGDEIESINDALKIAKMTDKELKDDIDNIIEYYKREHKKIIEYNKRIMNKNKNFYSWHIDYYNEDKIIIYKQDKEDENSYTCVSHIVKQIIKENEKYTFHLK
jgi:predicted  nucleic acid-binding Zn-ribbon protein